MMQLASSYSYMDQKQEMEDASIVYENSSINFNTNDDCATKPNQVPLDSSYSTCMPNANKERRTQHSKPKPPAPSEPEYVSKPLTGPIAKSHHHLPVDGTHQMYNTL